MPVATEPLHDQQLSVKRRVVMQMAKHILDVIGADTRVTIRYKGNMENLMTWGSDRYDAIDPLYFGQEDILELEVREQVSADMITPLRVHGKEYTPLWYRGEYPAYLSVNYLPVHWTISAKYFSRSDERMQNFQSRLSYRIALSNVVSLEAVHYLLTLPKPFLTLMTLFHVMEEKAYPTGRSLMDWMSAYTLDKGLVNMTNQAGNGGHPFLKKSNKTYS